tara:strand:- start:1851 stop:3164 length:1314 start_codon:yes stop_codon:yes gene_type:complete
MTQIVTNPLTLIETEIPTGKNKLSVDKLFHERKVYASLVPDDLLAYTVDLRLQSNLYGKVDGNLNAILPNTKKLKLDVENQVIAFDFVKELYEDFKRDWDYRCQNWVSSESMYQNLEFNTEYRDVNEILVKRYNNILTKFIDFSAAQFISDRVVNFETFINEFIEYLKRADLVFSREQFIKSRLYENRYSLLIVNLFDKGSFQDDEQNFKFFYLDDGISLAAQTLIRHGFLLDRFAPWRVLVNLNSPQLRTRKRKDPEGKPVPNSSLPLTGGASQVFAEYFVPSYKTELAFLKAALFNLYNLYVEKAPKSTFSYCKVSLKPITVKFKRKPLRRLQEISDVSIFKFYMKLRLYETKKAEKVPLIKQIKKISKDPSGIPKALDLLQNYTKTPRQYSKFDNEMDALEFANKIGCKGTHTIDKKFYPCKSHRVYLSLTKKK